ncbi:26S proteasome non-ATPase regulatory subunit 4 [Tanacetum coccineum]
MEGEVTVICVDTSITNQCWFLDQKRAVEFYCECKLNAHPDNLVGIVTSSHLDSGCLLAPTHNRATVTYSLALIAGKQVYQCIDASLLRGFALFDAGLFPQEDMKKRIVLFSGGGSPFSTAGHSPEAMASSLKKIDGRVALDVIDFGTRVMDKEDFKAKYLKALVDAMNDNNENEDSHYFLIKDDGLSLSHHISSSSILPSLLSRSRASMSLMEGEVTMICVDTSITSLCCFNDQIKAAKIYCERKLKAHPENFVSIARFGQRDLGTHLDLTNCLEEVAYKLGVLQPRKQEYTDLLEGFKLFRLGWFGQEYMKKRIVVFSGGPLLSTTGQSPEAMASFLKKGHVVLDVIDFGTRVKGKEDCKAKYLKALVAAMNDNNENEDSRYFLIEDDGFSLSHHISSSSILPPLVLQEAPISRTLMKADKFKEDKRREEWMRKIEEDKRREAWNQKIEEDKKREEWNQKIEKMINLIESFIQNPISSVKTPQPVTTLNQLRKEGFGCALNKSKGSHLGLRHCAANRKRKKRKGPFVWTKSKSRVAIEVGQTEAIEGGLNCDRQAWFYKGFDQLVIGLAWTISLSAISSWFVVPCSALVLLRAPFLDMGWLMDSYLIEGDQVAVPFHHPLLMEPSSSRAISTRQTGTVTRDSMGTALDQMHLAFP